MKRLRIYCCLDVESEKDLWHHDFVDTLRKMEHEVLAMPRVGFAELWYRASNMLLKKQELERVTEDILDDVKRKHKQKGIDFLFCYLFPWQFTPRLFKELDKLSIPSVYFFCDNLFHNDVSKKYAPYATLNWVPEKNAIRQFQASKSRYIYLPMAANPEINYPVAVKETVDISFLGANKPYRRNLLGQVLKSGLNLKIYGARWYPGQDYYNSIMEIGESLKTGGIAAYLKFKTNALMRLAKNGIAPALHSRWYARLGEEYEKELQAVACKKTLNRSEVNEIYSLSSVSIGISADFNPLSKERFEFYAKLRDFEATMAGACYLTQATPEGPELFEDGKEVMFYSTADELIDKARFLLKNEPFRKKLKCAARIRALSEHTWAHRFQRIFSELRLS